MSELINNQTRKRDRLKALIRQLHDGESFESVQQQFSEQFADVSAAEISAMEQELVLEGLPVSDIQRLCDVHAAVFKGSISEIHQPQKPEQIPGHPVQVFHRENRLLEALIETELEEPVSQAIGQAGFPGGNEALFLILHTGLEKVRTLDKHYSRKENLLFPYLERYGITAPPKVMWGVDDAIRDLIRQAVSQVSQWGGQAAFPARTGSLIAEMCTKIREMIFKEEQILLPLALETLKESDWQAIAQESPDIGYCLMDADQVPAWNAKTGTGPSDDHSLADEASAVTPDGLLRLPSGVLSLTEITRILDTLPVDLTFVDADDTVRYFSQGRDRIFARTKAVIGRKVVHCHPPASVHVVERILQDFKTGARDQADFWIHMGPRYVLIRYYAVRSEAGQYLGTLEITQDIAPIQVIEGEQRLLQ